MTQKFDYVVLGAGKPHSGDTPTILTNVTKDQILVEWILAAFDIPLEDITFISGYESDLVSAQYPAMNCIENEIWGTTKTLYSLSLGLSSKTNTNAVIVSYSDIVIKKKSIDLMKECAAPIVLLVEENGSLDYTTKTVPKPFEWVATCDSQLKKIGYNLLPCERTGRFVGCVKFSNETVNLIKQIISELDFETIASMHLTEMIEILRCRGLETRVIDVSGDWTEIRQDGDIARFMLGTKADTLLNLMPVLKSSVILDQVTFSIKNWQADSIAILESIESNLIKHKNSRLIVRSSSQAEDTFASSNAGSFESILGVRPGVELQEAIEKVISSYETTSNVDQILVQPMLQGVTLSGVAFTRSLRNKAPYYVINYELTNKTDTITSGVSTEHQTLYVFRDGILSEAIESKFSALLAAIQEIEQVLNYDCLDIEFAIADETIYLFQVRPLSDGISTAKIKDTEYANIIEQAKNLWDDLYFASPFVPGDSKPLYGIMPDWNPAEIIGTAPGELARSLYEYLIMNDTWSQQRQEFGYRDLRPSPLMVNFCGRPYVDVRLSLASFLPATLNNTIAAKILNFSLQRLIENPSLHDKIEFEILPTCFAPDFDNWAKLYENKIGLSKIEIDELKTSLQELTAFAFKIPQQQLAMLEILEERTKLIRENVLHPLERANLLLDCCKRFGTLPFAHLARTGFIAVSLLRGAVNKQIISDGAFDGFMRSIRTISHEMKSDSAKLAQGILDRDIFVERYGHLRPGTYEIMSPRYDSQPEVFLNPQLEINIEEDESDIWTLEKEKFTIFMNEIGFRFNMEEIETFLRSAIEGREYAKFVFSRVLSDALECISEFGSNLGLERKILSNISFKDLMDAHKSTVSNEEKCNILNEIASKNLFLRNLASNMNLPSLISEKSQFESYISGADEPNFIGSDKIIAPCRALKGVENLDGMDLRGAIVLIPQADPGYDWLFSQGIVGLVTMYGGANSHMAIRSAEYGLPAAIGVGEHTYNLISDAGKILIDPENKILSLIN